VGMAMPNGDELTNKTTKESAWFFLFANAKW